MNVAMMDVANNSVKIDANNIATGTLHLLNGCKVDYTGEAPVSDYFNPTDTGIDYCFNLELC